MSLNGKHNTFLLRASSLQSAKEFAFENFSYGNFYPWQFEHLSIEAVREISSKLLLKSAGNKEADLHLVFFLTASQEAQNAFLKIIEELPQGQICVIASPYTDLLKDTLRSRLFALPDVAHKRVLDTAQTQAQTFAQANYDKRQELIQKLKNKDSIEDILNFLEALEFLTQQKIKENAKTHKSATMILKLKRALLYREPFYKSRLDALAFLEL